MSTSSNEDNDAVLSDVDAEDAVLPIICSRTLRETLYVDGFGEVLEELDRERKSRIAAELSKSELLLSYNRLKAAAHDAIKTRDYITKQRNEALFEKDEAMRSNEKLSNALSESSLSKDEVVKQRDYFARQFEEALKAKESLRSEMETAAQMLVNGIEKISGKVTNFKDFNAGEFPRSQKYTGMLAVAYGVIKRTNDIVEELLTHNTLTEKSRLEANQQIDRRNYEIAIEISQLESVISGLREETSTKTHDLEVFKKSISGKNQKISEMLENENATKNDVLRLKLLVSEYDEKMRDTESRMRVQRQLWAAHSSCIAKLRDEIFNIIKIVDPSKVHELELSQPSFFTQENDMELNLRASLSGMEFTYELSRHVDAKIRAFIDKRKQEVKSLNETVSQLVKEKERIGFLLPSVLSLIDIPFNLSCKSNKGLKFAENKLNGAEVDFSFNNQAGSVKVPCYAVEEEMDALSSTVENIIKQLKIEILELQNAIDKLRQQLEAQAVELIRTKHAKEEFKEKEKVANDNVEGLMMDIAAAEEEITRWKVAAQQEADVGKALEKEFVAKLSAAEQELKESEEKLKYKEETADAANAARDAAEKSLRIADLRASILREKVEKLAHQLDMTMTSKERHRYVCWPWQWRTCTHQSRMTRQDSHEMELSELLL